MRTCDIYDIAPRLQDFLSAFTDKNGAIHNVTPLEDEHPTLAPMALGQLLGLEAIGADQKREQQNRHERGNPTAVDDGTTCDDWRGLAWCGNTVRLAVRAELVEAHSPFDRLRANELKRTALRPAPGSPAHGSPVGGFLIGIGLRRSARSRRGLA